MKEVIEAEQAKAEVRQFVDGLNLLPKQKEGWDNIISIISEAVQYGFVSINGDVITQKLAVPITDTKGAVVHDSFTWKRVKASVKNAAIAKIVNKQPETNIRVCRALSTGVDDLMFDHLEVMDNDISLSLAVFFV
jgi:hypothetical protein